MKSDPPALLTIPAAAVVLNVPEDEIMLWVEKGVLTAALLCEEPWVLAEEISALHDQMVMSPDILLG